MKSIFVVILGVCIILISGCGDLLRDAANIIDDLDSENTSNNQGGESLQNNNAEGGNGINGNNNGSDNLEDSGEGNLNGNNKENSETRNLSENENENVENPETGENPLVVDLMESGNGNYSGNISTQLGLHDVEGDWIYFANQMDENKLYKVRLDGSALTQITDHEVYKIHVINDWVYYIVKDANVDYGLGDYFQRVKTDGSELEVLVEEPVADLHYTDNKFFFVSDSKVRVMLPNGEFNNLPYQASNISISGEHLVFYGLYENENAYMLGSIEGKDEEFLIHEGYGEFVLVENQLFYTRGNGDEGLFKLQLGETGSTLIIDDYIDFFNADENYVYYSTLESEASRKTLKTDHQGEDPQSIDTAIYNINIFDSIIIGDYLRQGYYSMYIIDKESHAMDEIVISH